MGVYEVTIPGETFSGNTHIAVASLTGAAFGFISTGSGGGKLIIYTADTSGNSSDTRLFNFVVYKK